MTIFYCVSKHLVGSVNFNARHLKYIFFVPFKIKYQPPVSSGGSGFVEVQTDSAVSALVPTLVEGEWNLITLIIRSGSTGIRTYDNVSEEKRTKSPKLDKIIGWLIFHQIRRMCL